MTLNTPAPGEQWHHSDVIFGSDTGRLASIPLWLLRSPITGNAIRLYGIMDAEWAQGRSHSSIAATRGQLANSMGVSKKTVDRLIGELEAVGAVQVKRRQCDDIWLPSIYTLSRIDVTTVDPQVSPPVDTNPPNPDALQTVAQQMAIEPIEKSSTRSVQVRTTEDDLFCEFYELYPVKKGRAQALKTWKKLNLPKDATLRQQVMDGVHAYARWVQRTRTESRFIPYPSTWLNGHRWEDVLANNEVPLTSQTKSLMTATEGFLNNVKGGLQ
jgi:hypothetical protein